LKRESELEIKSTESGEFNLSDFKPGQGLFRREVISGLQKPQKELPCKYFYDDQGSRLYERICALEEYYLPRTEIGIMNTHIEEIVELLGSGIILIEYGSGSSTKTRILLDHLKELVAYVPIDISREQLLRVAMELKRYYPQLDILPVCADFTNTFEIPNINQPYHRRVVYFPGSTIGNFDPVQARYLLAGIVRICGPNGGLLIGVDLEKDPEVLNRAYNDSQGVTAAFNLNILKRINRELGGDFKPEFFEHYSFYNPQEGRVEMHLISRKDQTVHLDDVTIPFVQGESIWTESSYKYNLTDFKQMAADAGFRVDRVWMDEQQWFSVQYLVRA